MRKLLLLVSSLTVFTACTPNIKGDRYLSNQPEFDLFNFFNGSVVAWGIVQDRSGNVVQQFRVDIDGKLSDGTLTLDETFYYQLGEGQEKRIWTIQQSSGDQLSGSASDIAGTATGRSFGNALQWSYEMDLPVGDSEYRVYFDDWMWAFDDQRIINRSYIKKFGLVMAEVTIFMEKKLQ